MNDDEREFYEERAAIREYLGGFSRKQAEILARHDLAERKRSYSHQQELARHKIQSDGDMEVRTISQRRAFEFARQLRGSQR